MGKESPRDDDGTDQTDSQPSVSHSMWPEPSSSPRALTPVPAPPPHHFIMQSAVNRQHLLRGMQGGGAHRPTEGEREGMDRDLEELEVDARRRSSLDQEQQQQQQQTASTDQADRILSSAQNNSISGYSGQDRHASGRGRAGTSGKIGTSEGTGTNGKTGTDGENGPPSPRPGPRLEGNRRPE